MSVVNTELSLKVKRVKVGREGRGFPSEKKGGGGSSLGGNYA